MSNLWLLVILIPGALLIALVAHFVWFWRTLDASDDEHIHHD